MNRRINMNGISRYWKPGEDDRTVIAEALYGTPDPTQKQRTDLDKAIDALFSVVMTRRRTKIVGVGVFEWVPWNNRIPTGHKIETMRLKFKPGRYVRRRYPDGIR